MLVNVKLDNVGKRDYFQNFIDLLLLVFLILNGTAKTKLTILSFLFLNKTEFSMNSLLIRKYLLGPSVWAFWICTNVEIVTDFQLSSLSG